jgi:hypothetical protein
VKRYEPAGWAEDFSLYLTSGGRRALNLPEQEGLVAVAFRALGRFLRRP